MPGVIALLFTSSRPLLNLPQMAETNTPQPMDAAGECSLYASGMVCFCFEENNCHNIEI
jgi:hypothetical protein